MNPVRQLRFQTGVTQEKLAAAAGTSQPTIAAYEADRKSPNLETVKNLAQACGVEAVISYVPPLTREDLRSLAYHRAIVEKLRQDPDTILAKARQNIEKMLQVNPHAKKLLNLWSQWLEFSIGDIVSCSLDVSMLARDMRQVTPFAGVLTDEERMRVIEEFKKERRR